MEEKQIMEKSEVIQIINYLKDPHLTEEQRVEAYRGLGKTGDKSAITFLLDKISRIDKLTWKEKNAVAISLGQLGADQAVPILMKVVNNKDYSGKSGSFLYAISIKPLECKEYFLDFIELLCTGSLEVRASAIELIESLHNKVDNDIKMKSIQIISKHKILIESQGKPKEKFDTINYLEYVENLLLINS